LSQVDQQIGFFDFEERKVAYATVGHGPVIAFPSWWISHVELEWRDPAFRAFFRALAAEHTVVRYDRIGVGLSDRRRSAAEMSLAFELAVFEALLAHLDIDRCSVVASHAADASAPRSRRGIRSASTRLRSTAARRAASGSHRRRSRRRSSTSCGRRGASARACSSRCS
jgi:hypothetical protein